MLELAFLIQVVSAAFYGQQYNQTHGLQPSYYGHPTVPSQPYPMTSTLSTQFHNQPPMQPYYSTGQFSYGFEQPQLLPASTRLLTNPYDAKQASIVPSAYPAPIKYDKRNNDEDDEEVQRLFPPTARVPTAPPSINYPPVSTSAFSEENSGYNSFDEIEFEPKKPEKKKKVKEVKERKIPIFGPPSIPPHRDRGQLVPIKWQLQNCYMNAFLQAIFHAPTAVETIVALDGPQLFGQQVNQTSDNPVVMYLARLSTHLTFVRMLLARYHGGGQPFDTSMLMQAWDSYLYHTDSPFRLGHSMDLSEFGQYFLQQGLTPRTRKQLFEIGTRTQVSIDLTQFPVNPSGGVNTLNLIDNNSSPLMLAGDINVNFTPYVTVYPEVISAMPQIRDSKLTHLERFLADGNLGCQTIVNNYRLDPTQARHFEILQVIQQRTGTEQNRGRTIHEAIQTTQIVRAPPILTFFLARMHWNGEQDVDFDGRPCTYPANLSLQTRHDQRVNDDDHGVSVNGITRYSLHAVAYYDQNARHYMAVVKTDAAEVVHFDDPVLTPTVSGDLLKYPQHAIMLVYVRQDLPYRFPGKNTFS